MCVYVCVCVCVRVCGKRNALLSGCCPFHPAVASLSGSRGLLVSFPSPEL